MSAACSASRKAKRKGEKSLILNIFYMPGTVLGMKKPKGTQEEKVKSLTSLNPHRELSACFLHHSYFIAEKTAAESG